MEISKIKLAKSEQKVKDLKGVVSSWKQPVFFAFDTPMIRHTMFQLEV